MAQHPGINTAAAENTVKKIRVERMLNSEQFLFTSKSINDLCQQIVQILPNSFADSVEAEIQEMGVTALFRISQSSTPSVVAEFRCHEVLLTVGNFLLSQLPTRKNGFRWMIVLLRNEQVIDSVFGGSDELFISG